MITYIGVFDDRTILIGIFFHIRDCACVENLSKMFDRLISWCILNFKRNIDCNSRLDRIGFNNVCLCATSIKFFITILREMIVRRYGATSSGVDPISY